ncbi:oxidoreductase [Sphaerisporangium krabiense]|uniref:Oxidoreductase n=1 Tax=Sphaerisporangium krabiense TaxID=763782 RepID=A0A7W9DRT1_9ACTN|nr:Gfo/Idh/MocA family oxidoreductase [Sphaerisporangium krabiense]MBB5628449.1 oxidoreductase [Sphaerisporangium krabiense]GII66812.1 oxidoreductase [Sphaerisporangium krabiense]
MSTVRAAVVGLGWSGRELWLRRLAANPAYQVTALADPDDDALAAAAEIAPGARCARRVEEIGPDLADLAIVAVPNHLHTPTAETLLGNGVSVFVEKPVCLSRPELERLRAAEAASAGRLLAGSAARWRADVGTLRSVVPALGRIRLVELSWVRARGIPRQGGWFTERQRSGGGALIDLGWHLLDVGLDLIGRPGIVQACAVTSADLLDDGRWSASWRGDRAASGQRDVEDGAAGFLVTDDGVGMFLRTAWASHQPYDLTKIRLHGSAATASLSCTFGFSPTREPTPRLVVHRAGIAEPVPLPQEPVGAEYHRQLEELPLLLAGGGPRGRALDETATIISAIESLYASAGPPRSALKEQAG